MSGLKSPFMGPEPRIRAESQNIVPIFFAVTSLSQTVGTRAQSTYRPVLQEAQLRFRAQAVALGMKLRATPFRIAVIHATEWMHRYCRSPR